MILRTPRPGFTLLEMVCVMAVFALILPMGISLILVSVRAQQATDQVSLRLAHHHELATHFRFDVRNAEKSLDAFQDFQADEHCLILRQDNNRTLVYLWNGRELIRKQFLGEVQTQTQFPLSRQTDDVQFLTQGNLKSLRIREKPPRATTPQSIEFSAILGGNRK